MDSMVHRIQTALQTLMRNIESEHLERNEYDITRPQMYLLYVLKKNGKCKLAQLAEKLEVKPSAITVMIDRVENAGYVKRTHDTVDRRSVLVEVTPLGEEVLKKSIEARNEILKRYLSRLKPEEIPQLTEWLEELATPGNGAIEIKNDSQ